MKAAVKVSGKTLISTYKCSKLVSRHFFSTHCSWEKLLHYFVSSQWMPKILPLSLQIAQAPKNLRNLLKSRQKMIGRKGQ